MFGEKNKIKFDNTTWKIRLKINDSGAFLTLNSNEASKSSTSQYDFVQKGNRISLITRYIFLFFSPREKYSIRNKK